MKESKKILSNFGYLSVFNLLTIGFPLLVYPYLNNALGTEVFGSVIFVQAVFAYLIVFISYGFNVTGTKMIANCPQFSVVDIFWGCTLLRSIFATSSIFFVLILSPLLPDSKLYIALIPVLLNEVFFPQWYYQGVEKMKTITIINLFSRTLSVILILIFIESPSDVYLYAFLYSSVPLFVSFLSFLFLIKNKRFLKEFDFYSLGRVFTFILKESNAVFLGSVVSVIKDRTNIIFIGIFIGNELVVVYDFILKVINVISGFFSSFTNAQFPVFVKNYRNSLLKKYLKITVILSFLVALLGVFCLYFIQKNDGLSEGYLSLIFEKNFFGIYIFLCLLIPFRAIGYQVGMCVLIANNYQRKYMDSLIISFIVFVLLSLLVLKINPSNIYLLIAPLVFSVFIEMLHRIVISFYLVGQYEKEVV